MLRICLALIGALAMGSLAQAAEPLALEATGAVASVDTMTGQPLVAVKLSQEGQATLAAFTAEHVGQRVDLLVDDTVVTSPMVTGPLDLPVVHISGLETSAEAETIAAQLAEKKAQIFVRLATGAE